MTQEAARDHSGNGVQTQSPRCAAWVIVCAGASLLLYWQLPGVATMISSAIPSYAFEMFPWVAKVTGDSISATHAAYSVYRGELMFGLCCAGLFAIYAFMLRMAKGCQSLRIQRVIFACGAAFLILQLFAPVMLSTDVFAYAFYGRVLSVHHANAYVDTGISSDIFLTLFKRQSIVSMYGPLWTLISAGITRVTGDNVGLTVLVFRGFSALASLCASALIWKSLRIFSPERATQGLVMFLWNPLVIIESGLSGHNDPTMVALAGLGVWLHFKGCKTGTVVALALSALVKFITGMLIPLYILMTLRGMKSWRERILFLLRCGAGLGVAMGLVVFFARVKTDVPAGNQATSPGFYANNFHELIFKGLRRLLGEDAESVKAPVTDGSWAWWVEAHKDTMLRSTPSESGEIEASVAQGQKLIVITQPLIPWLRVYDPASRKKGYVAIDAASYIPDPGKFAPDPELERLERSEMQWPTVLTANRWIRIVTWTLFAAFGLLAAWKAVEFDRFLIWSGAALLASYYLVITQMWPWYILWALAFGALKPDRLPARLAVLLSGFVLTLYITIGYDSGESEWVYTWRSVPAIVLPLLVFLVTLAMKGSIRRTRPEMYQPS